MNLKKLFAIILSSTVAISSCFINCFGSKVEDELDLSYGDNDSLDIYKDNRLSSEIIKELNESGYVLESESPIGVGSFSLVFLVKDSKENKCVVKIPKRSDEGSLREWSEEKQKTYEALKKIFVYIKCYNGNVRIPKILEIKERYIVEEYAGKNLIDISNQNLTGDEREYIISELAMFFDYIFNQDKNDKIVDYESIYNKFSNDNVFKRLLAGSKEYKVFFERDKSDEIETWVFPDLHLENIIYNRDTGIISIIDIDGLKKDCIYKNFLSLAVCDESQTGLSDFIKDLIKQINSYNNIKIDVSKWEFFKEIESSDYVAGRVYYN